MDQHPERTTEINENMSRNTTASGQEEQNPSSDEMSEPKVLIQTSPVEESSGSKASSFTTSDVDYFTASLEANLRKPLAWPLQRPDKGCTDQGCDKTLGHNIRPENREGGYIKFCRPAATERPRGTQGKKVELMVNHFPVSTPKDDVVITHYVVTLDPPSASKEVNMKLKNLLQEEWFDGEFIAYDGRQNLYIAEKTRLKKSELDTDPCRLRFCPWSGGRVYQVTLKRVRVLNGCNLKKFLKGETMEAPRDYLQALDIVLRDTPSWLYYVVNRSFYYDDRITSADLTLTLRKPARGGASGSVWALPGFTYSLSPLECGLALNLDVSAAPFHARKCVIHYLQGLGIDPTALLEDPQLCLTATTALFGLCVCVTHRKTSCVYNIVGISDRSAMQIDIFDNSLKVKRNIVEYFETRYAPISIRRDLPCLIVRSRGDTYEKYTEAHKYHCYLPMDVCLIAEGQMYEGMMSDVHKMILRSVAGDTPDACYGKINSTFRDLKDLLHSQYKHRDNPSCREDRQDIAVDYQRIRPINPFGLRLGKKMIQVTGRVIEPPKIISLDETATKGRVPTVVYKSGSVLSLSQWAVIIFTSSMKGMADRLKFTLECILSGCSAMGIECFPQWEAQGSYHILNPSLLDDFNHLRLSLFSLKKERLKQAKFLFCIFDADRPVKTSCYANLKHLCETQLGWLTQCCLTRHVDVEKDRGRPARVCAPAVGGYRCKISLKVNAKLGGTNIALNENEFFQSVFGEDQVIVFGVSVSDRFGRGEEKIDDTYESIYDGINNDHMANVEQCERTRVPIFYDERRRGLRIRAVAAVVGSMDWPNLGQYCARTRRNGSSDAIRGLSEMVLELLRLHIDRNEGRKPKRAVLFREGVGDSAFQYLVKTEFKMLRQRLESECPGMKVTWVGVEARHGTKLFIKEGKKICNVEAGTVVDSQIVHPTQFDFYLASETATKAMNTATHYFVLSDENKFSADEMQRFVFYLCHTEGFSNSTAVVPPVLYAGLAASRAHSIYAKPGDTDVRQPSPEVINTMYFC